MGPLLRKPAISISACSSLCLFSRAKGFHLDSILHFSTHCVISSLLAIVAAIGPSPPGGDPVIVITESHIHVSRIYKLFYRVQGPYIFPAECRVVGQLLGPFVSWCGTGPWARAACFTTVSLSTAESSCWRSELFGRSGIRSVLHAHTTVMSCRVSTLIFLIDWGHMA